jgi:hypothetical protein
VDSPIGSRHISIIEVQLNQPQLSPYVMLDTPSGSAPLKYSIEQIPEEPDAQVAATIARMCQYVTQDYVHPIVQAAAQTALSFQLDPTHSYHIPPPLACIHSFVRSRLVFKRDEETAQPFAPLLKQPGQGAKDDYFVECLTRPVDVLWQYAQTGQPVAGDCDDFSMLCAALLMALGIDCCFATVGADASDPNVFSHVYVVAYWRGARYPIDCSHGPHAGWEAPNKYGKFAEWPIYDRSTWGGLGVALALAGFFAWHHRKTIKELFA